MPPFIGIDLGTMFTTAAAAAVPGRAAVIAGPTGRRRLRSVVAVGEGTAIVGRTPAGARAVECVKSTLGDPDRRFPLASGHARPEEIAALLLARIRADAERTLRTGVAEAVLTVPATFGLVARSAVRDAAHIAGLRVRSVLTEPAAAALAVRDRLPAECTILVFSLGGGVFDGSLLRLGRGGVEVQATAGDSRLGGWDWDNLLMRAVQDRLTAAGGPDLLATEQAEAHLRVHARAAKHRLSAAPQTTVTLHRGGAAWPVPLTRADFEAATRSPLRRTQQLVERLLSSSGVEPGQLDRVLLVGGPTRMPAVRQMLRRLLGVRPVAVAYDAVALGAAAYDPEVPVREVASHGVGLVVRSARTGELRNATVVPAGAALPAGAGVAFTTGEGDPGRLLLDVTAGDGADVDAVRVVHRSSVALGAPPGTPVQVCFRYDAEQRLRVEVRTSGHLRHTVEVRPSDAMTEPELTAASARTAALPRDP